MKNIILLIVALLFLSCNRQTSKTDHKKDEYPSVNTGTNSEEQEYMVEAFTEMVQGTSFTAVVKHYRIDSFPIKNNDSSDDCSEKRIVLHAEVIKQFKGIAKKNITYDMVVEKGESVILKKEPQIICLCLSDGTYYWPGTGSVFPVKEVLINKAKEIKATKSINGSDTFCLE